MTSVEQGILKQNLSLNTCVTAH